jgi:hypothetical protein
MITLPSVYDLQAAKEDIEHVKESYPQLFDKLAHVISLTRALQFPYQYMGSLLMDEDPGNKVPHFVKPSVLSLYKREVQSVKEDIHFSALKEVLNRSRSLGYAKIGQLVLGQSPESLIGPSSIK